MAKEQGKYTKREYTPETTIKNELQKEIVAQCYDWLFKKNPGETWEEQGLNKGEMLNTMKKEFGIIKPNDWAWCAIFAWVILEEACKVVKAKNILPKHAGARAMRDLSIATNKIIVKPLPEIGSVMYRKSLDIDSSGHIGIVVKIDPDKSFYTVEGNMNDKVVMTKYDASRFYDAETNQYWLKGVPFSFMWTGRFPYTGKARNVDVNAVNKMVTDTLNTAYFDTGKPNNSTRQDTGGEAKPVNKKRRKRREFR